MEVEAVRFVGRVKVELEYLGETSFETHEYRARLTAGDKVYESAGHYAPKVWDYNGTVYDSPEAFDEIAAAAVEHAAYFTTGNRGRGVPEDAPSAEVADALRDAAAEALRSDEGGYVVRREAA